MPNDALQSNSFTLQSGSSINTRQLLSFEEGSDLSLLPFRIGQYKLAVEANMVASLGGHELKNLLSSDEEKSFLPDHALIVPLAQELGEPAPEGREYLICKGKEKERVLIMIDEIDRLVHLPLQKLRALPPVTKETIKVPFIWAMAIVNEEIISLIDPESLYQYALRRSTHG